MNLAYRDVRHNLFRFVLTCLGLSLLLAVVLDSPARLSALRDRMRERGFDGRLLTRLLREGHVEAATEEAVWAVLENDVG